mmetsp:Transcript_35323/g.105506  ORF Transcript_35323/g.105506 Transcript_35323/m.105506 type:complete len:270 (-) Transcript_35323:412-1221(-)
MRDALRPNSRHVPSLPPLSTCDPSAENARHDTVPPWARSKRRRHIPFSTFHTLMTPSPSPVPRRAPSAATASAVTAPSCVMSSSSFWYRRSIRSSAYFASGSHISTNPSDEPVTRPDPSGRKAAHSALDFLPNLISYVGREATFSLFARTDPAVPPAESSPRSPPAVAIASTSPKTRSNFFRRRRFFSFFFFLFRFASSPAPFSSSSTSSSSSSSQSSRTSGNCPVWACHLTACCRSDTNLDGGATGISPASLRASSSLRLCRERLFGP